MRSKVTIGLFSLLLTLFFIMVVILPKDETSAKKENRSLAECPEFSFDSLFNGQYTRDFETYLSDKVGFRSVLTDISAAYDNVKGINKLGKLVSASGDLGVGTTTKNQLLVLEDRVMEVYKVNQEARTQYIDMIDHYADRIPDTINVYSMLIPTQLDFLDFYSTAADSEKDSIDYFYSHFNSRVQNIDIYDTLKEHYTQGEYVYFRTDHHWTTLGAFYAYQEMAKKMYIPSLNLKDFEKKEEDGFLGHLYEQAKSPGLAAHADTIEYYVNYTNDIPIHPITYSYEPGKRLEYNGKMFCPELGADYKLFLAGDHPFIEIDSDAENDRTLMILKDSYTNALLPWLACGYSQILVIDARTFDQTVNEVLGQYEVDDFLITNYIMGTNFTDYIELCRDIFTDDPIIKAEPSPEEPETDEMTENQENIGVEAPDIPSSDTEDEFSGEYD